MLWIRQKLGADPVDYINGPETLPAPLNKEEEAKAFKLLLTDEKNGIGLLYILPKNSNQLELGWKI